MLDLAQTFLEFFQYPPAGLSLSPMAVTPGSAS